MSFQPLSQPRCFALLEVVSPTGGDDPQSEGDYEQDLAPVRVLRPIEEQLDEECCHDSHDQSDKDGHEQQTARGIDGLDGTWRGGVSDRPSGNQPWRCHASGLVTESLFVPVLRNLLPCHATSGGDAQR